MGEKETADTKKRAEKERLRLKREAAAVSIEKQNDLEREITPDLQLCRRAAVCGESVTVFQRRVRSINDRRAVAKLKSRK